jgi:hypothetical protein
MPDWKYASIAALILLGLAAFIVFVIHPGGFEGQIAWLFGLLPGAFLGSLIASPLARIAPFSHLFLFGPSFSAPVFFGTSV